MAEVHEHTPVPAKKGLEEDLGSLIKGAMGTSLNIPPFGVTVTN